MKFALCNEVFQDLSIEDGFSKIAEIGYQGVEIGAFTLQENPLELSEEDADRCRGRRIERFGNYRPALADG